MARAEAQRNRRQKHTPVTDKEFWIDPINLNMVPNESQDIHVWDWRGNDVSARVSWSLSDTGIVDMMVKHHATISAKMPGTMSVIGSIDGHTIEAIVTVYRGEKLPDGVIGSRYASVVVRVYPADKMPKGVERPLEVIKPAGSE